MKIPDFPLSEIEKQKILKKSARQNLFSILKLMRNLKDVQKIFSVYKLSGIKLKDLL
jgi:hypothetical protein